MQQNFALYLCITFAVIYLTVSAPPLPAPFTEHCIVGEKNLYPPKGTALKWYTVDLDKAPEDRWTEIVLDYKENINELLDVVKNLSYAFFGGKLVQFVDKNFGHLDEKFSSPFREELQGIAKVTGIPLGELVLYNVFYEISSVCTAILGQDSTGKLFHARNMDFGLFMGWDPKTHDWEISEKIRKNQVQVKFIRGGETLYEGVAFPGFLGLFSGMKKDRYTLTINERYNLKGGYLGLIRWLFGTNPQNFTTFLAREVMENYHTYDEAKELLMSRNLSSPIYFLLGGNKTDQGCLIVRGLTDMPKKIELSEAPEKWYILQTNYDPWKTPLYLDDRRTPGNLCMHRLGQSNLNFAGLYNVLSSTPNYNLLTVFTHLMQVGTKMETYSQKCEQPCWFA